MLLVTMMALLAAESNTILVENASGAQMTLIEASLPQHYEPLVPATTVAPAETVRSMSRTAKILVPHSASAEEAVRLHFTDARGNGCVFEVAPTPHSPTWQKMRPRARALGTATCEARTGRTIGDFVYVVR